MQKEQKKLYGAFLDKIVLFPTLILCFCATYEVSFVFLVTACQNEKKKN